MTTTEELPIPKEYQEASIRFRWAWIEYKDKEKEVKDEIVYMVEILEDEGDGRTKAIQKIVEDHKDLKGFSRATIYRELPDDMKQQNTIRELKKYKEENNNNEDVTNKPSQLSNDNYESINITTPYEVKNAETINDTVNEFYDTKDSENKKEQEEFPLFVVDLPPPKPELQNPKVTAFVGKLPKSVLRLAEKIELAQSKLELIANYSNKSILKDHRQIQEKLVKSIAPLTTDQTKVEISQAIRDLETGAIKKIEGQNSYVRDYDLREKIPQKVDRVKHPIEYYQELGDKFKELMYLGTGHKLTEDETDYEPNHVTATQKYRFALLNELTERQIAKLVEDIEIVQDLLDSFLHEIEETINNNNKK